MLRPTRAFAFLCGCVVLAAASIPRVIHAQHGAAASAPDTRAPDTRAPRDASQFAFLIGQWDVIVTPKATTLATRIHGVPRMHGTWKAWRAFEGWGIEDELRIVDDAGNPVALTHFVRAFDPATKRWKVSALDVFRTKFTMSTAAWKGGVMHTESQGVDTEGKSYMSRVTWSNITPTSFRYQQDRSIDGGGRWTDAFLVIEAKRTAAAASR